MNLFMIFIRKKYIFELKKMPKMSLDLFIVFHQNKFQSDNILEKYKCKFVMWL